MILPVFVCNPVKKLIPLQACAIFLQVSHNHQITCVFMTYQGDIINQKSNYLNKKEKNINLNRNLSAKSISYLSHASEKGP